MGRRFFFRLVVVLFITSCGSIIGITDDYTLLNSEQRSLIHEFSAELELVNGNVYAIGGKQLKEELSKHDKSLVYCFTNGCSSENCESHKNYLEFASEHGYKLFMVMNGYGNINATLDQFVPIPYFAINAGFYESRYSWKYIRYFQNELLDRPLNYKEKEYQGSLFFFERSECVNIKRQLES